MTSTLIAVVDPAARAFLADNLIADGYRVRAVGDLPTALAELGRQPHELVIAALAGDGLALLDAVRGGRLEPDPRAGRPLEPPATDPGVPLVLLDEDADAMSRQRAYERGADEYVPRPFSYPELRARVANLLRRAGQYRERGVLRCGAMAVDPIAHRVTVGHRRVEVPNREFTLLLALAAEPERVFTKPELLRELWGFRSEGRTRTLDSHASRLRRRLAEAGAPGLVSNVWGIGYRLIDTPLAAVAS